MLRKVDEVSLTSLVLRPETIKSFYVGAQLSSGLFHQEFLKTD
jgi:hypothetical protein